MSFIRIMSVAAIATMLISCRENRPASQPPQVSGQPEASQVSNPGQLLFEQKCAACHGADGTAGISNAANLQTSRMDSAAIIKLINEGKNNMPSFASQLSAEQIKMLAGYILTLRK